MLTSHIQLNLNKRLGYVSNNSLEKVKLISLANEVKRQYNEDTTNTKKFLKDQFKELVRSQNEQYTKEKEKKDRLDSLVKRFSYM